MARIYAPDRDTVAVDQYERAEHGGFDIDDQALAEHLLRFGWSDQPPVHEPVETVAEALVDGESRVEREPDAAPLPSLKGLRKDDLVALAVERGVDATGTAAQIKARLHATHDTD